MVRPSRIPPAPASTVALFPPERRSDASLLVGVREGDRDALGVLWDRYSIFVRGVLFGALGSDAAIEDLTQEVFLALLKNAARIEDPGALRGYLAQVAVRQAALEIRKRRVRRWVGLSSSGDLPEVPSPARVDVEHREILHALHRTLERLSVRRRMAFVLRHMQGLEMTEVAAALSISESTLRRELDFARDFLRRASEPALREFLSSCGGIWS